MITRYKWDDFIANLKEGDFIFYINHDMCDWASMLTQLGSGFCHCEYYIDSDRAGNFKRTISAVSAGVIVDDICRQEKAVRKGKKELIVCRLERDEGGYPDPNDINVMKEEAFHHFDMKYDIFQIISFAVCRILRFIPLIGPLIAMPIDRLNIGSDRWLICSESCARIAWAPKDAEGRRKFNVCLGIDDQDITPQKLFDDHLMEIQFATEKD